jgi:MFS transporter, putative metabolite:H+ symporter
MSSLDPTLVSTSGSHGVSYGNLIARLEQLPRNAMRVRARLLVGLATFFDGFDVIAIATTLPLLIHQWHLSPAQIAILIGSSSIGQLIGAFIFPWFAERHGRIRAIALSSGLIGLTSIACGFAPGYLAFLVLRMIQGIGLGGELPVAATYINEISRSHGRGRFVLLYEIVFPIGLLVCNTLGAWLVPQFGWQVVYFVGGLPLLLLFTLGRLVPESPRWLAEHGRLQDADRALHAFELTASAPLPVLAKDAGSDYEKLLRARPQRRLRDVFAPPYLHRTIVVSLIWATCGFIQYGMSTWLPTIYKAIYHAPLQLALNLAVLATLLGVVGAAICAFIVDYVGRRPVISVSFVLCACSLFMAGLLHAQSVYVVATFCSLAFGFLASGFITAYVYTPELYPTSIRAFGCGVGSAWTKIAAIFAPMIVSKTLAGGNIDIAFYILGTVPLIAAFAVRTLGIETKEKVLEQLDA